MHFCFTQSMACVFGAERKYRHLWGLSMCVVRQPITPCPVKGCLSRKDRECERQNAAMNHTAEALRAWTKGANSSPEEFPASFPLVTLSN